MDVKNSKQNIFYEDNQLGPYPMHRLKRVDKPTTLITNEWHGFDAREGPYGKGERGEYGPAVQRELPRFVVKYPLADALQNVLVHLAAFGDSPVADNKAPIPDDPAVISQHIKRLGYFLKADVMGICELPKAALYSHDRQGNLVNMNYKYAIVIAAAKEYETEYASTGCDWSGDVISFQSYQRVSMIAQTIAEYIRILGYPAIPQHPPSSAGRYQVVLPPLLLWAGIGELSRTGIILNPFLGLGYKASAVLTDLPLIPDKPIDFKLQEFCRLCRVCAEECPSQAISKDSKVIYNGYKTWKIDTKRCFSFCVLNKRGGICNRCVKVCPWTRPATWTHNLVRWSVQHSDIARRFAIKTDRFFGHGKAHEKGKWWFDLENIDGVLRIPSKSDREAF
jgi:reductive dehalogenase